MTIGTALAIIVMLAAPVEGPRPVADAIADQRAAVPAQPVLAEMAPAPGHWEVEDAPAYFSDRTAFPDAIAPHRLSADRPADALPGHRLP